MPIFVEQMMATSSCHDGGVVVVDMISITSLCAINEQQQGGEEQEERGL